MGILLSISEHKRYRICLNVSFLVLASVFLVLQFNSTEFVVLRSSEPFATAPSSDGSEKDCKQLSSISDYRSKCHYLSSENPCKSGGYIDYLSLFYCNFAKFPYLGHCLLILWLFVLFYLLGNTASEYFCASLENLSALLKLSPTIAGVTLLSLGNGAPDVFASLVSFMGGSGTSDVGFNTVLGGASFITSVVVGLMSILVHKRNIRVSKSAFVRDISFFLLVLASLTFILLHGKINLWGAIGFLSVYIFYVMVVYSYENLGLKDSEKDANSCYASDLRIPILSSKEKEANLIEEGALEGSNDDEEEMQRFCFCLPLSPPCSMLIYILEMPLYLPRRLTIPVVSEKKWSQPVAVASVVLAPVLLSALWNPHYSSLKNSFLVYGIGFLVGGTVGVLAYLTTEKSSPPKKWLLPWLVGGFIMSVTWSYIIAQELVSLLVSLGYIFQISPSILGLTVLAWGNSLGDLITDLTMALTGGAEGAQIAISGCYAGPIFNILFGLGLSLVGSSWQNYPSSVVIPRDPYVLETLCFLGASLIWAIVILPSRKMRLDGVLGGGLLGIYLIAISVRLIQTVAPLDF